MSFLHGRFRGLQSLDALASVLVILATYFAGAWLNRAVPLQGGGMELPRHLPEPARDRQSALLSSGLPLGRCAPPDLPRGGSMLPFGRTTNEIAAMAMTLLIGIVLTKDGQVSRLFLLVLFPALRVVLFLSHIMVHRLAAPLLFRGHRSLRTFVVASVTSHDPLVDWLRAHNHLGLQLAAIHAPRLPEEYADLDARRFGDTPEEAIARFAPQVVICGDAHLSREELAQHPDCGRERWAAGLPFTLIVSPVSAERQAFTATSGTPWPSFAGSRWSLPSAGSSKGCLTWRSLFPVVLLLLPFLMLLVAVIHRLQSPGPLFFKQRRKGVGGQVFLVYKFRTMYCDHGREAEQARAGDSRIFPAGLWMRKFSIDEFPQFLNVVAGEMSVVGPRPHYVEHDTDFAAVDPLYRFRKFLKPGVTGLAQVMGYRGITNTRASVRERSYADLEYLENWSLRLDFIILLKTAWHVLHPPKSAQ